MYKILDLYCGAGGCSMGYSLAGFEVTGVDHKKQKHYPFKFILSDALEYLKERGHEYDAIHASPPCQKFSKMRKGRWQDREHLDLVTPTRELLIEIGKPYIIENVLGSPLLHPVILCGTMFGLQTKEGSQLRRHRLFELSWTETLVTPPHKHNDGSAIGVYGTGGQHPARRRPATIGVWGNSGGHSERDNLDHYGVDARREAMGISWMTQVELSQAIPPAYTKFIGEALKGYLDNHG